MASSKTNKLPIGGSAGRPGADWTLAESLERASRACPPTVCQERRHFRFRWREQVETGAAHSANAPPEAPALGTWSLNELAGAICFHQPARGRRRRAPPTAASSRPISGLADSSRVAGGRRENWPIFHKSPPEASRQLSASFRQVVREAPPKQQEQQQVVAAYISRAGRLVSSQRRLTSRGWDDFVGRPAARFWWLRRRPACFIRPVAKSTIGLALFARFAPLATLPLELRDGPSGGRVGSAAGRRGEDLN